jgi:hypothetical protein
MMHGRWGRLDLARNLALTGVSLMLAGNARRLFRLPA